MNWRQHLASNEAAGGFRRVAMDALRARRSALITGGSLISAFLAVGGLHWGPALAGAGVLIAWAALWPRASNGTADGSSHSGATSPTERQLAGEETHPPIWRAMLEGLPDPALILDRQAIVIAANARARQVFAANTARHISQFSRSPDLLAAVEQALATGDPQSFRTRMPVPVERHVAGMVTAMSQKPYEHAAPALLIVLRDLTEQEQLSRMRADFVANASHELRTPLASLKGFVETLQGAAKDDPVARARFLDIMHEQAGRMSRLIDDLLSLSRVEMHEHVAPQSVLDLGELVANSCRALEPLAKTAKITLAFAPPAEREFVVGDRDELLQLAQNLIQNAIKYGVRGGRVDVAIKEENSRIALSIADNGIGIAPEHLPRLTERFYRVSAKDSRERGGTGLGLAIVKHIVNHHRGELRVTSKLGEGSVFTVLLPRAPATAERTAMLAAAK